MNAKDAISVPANRSDKLDQEVVAMIRPLPEDVVPSEKFLQQMRGRLLQLQAAKAAASKRAA